MGRGIILERLKNVGAVGIYHVGVKSVDMVKNAEGEGRQLGIS